jgi:hypothetical protein
MKKRFGIYLVVLAVTSLLLAACGGGGGGGFFALPSVTVTADKRIAMANGSEDVTLTATVHDFSGAAMPGTTISFVITSGTGSLHSADLKTGASGTAGVKVNRLAIDPPGTSQDITITASAAGVSGSKTVRFINRPTEASIQVVINPSVSNLATLTFDLITGPTQTTTLLSIEPINEAIIAPFIGPNGPGTQNTFTSILNPPSTYTLFTSLNPGITTKSNSPIVGFVFGIDATDTELPTYVIGPDHITAFVPSGFALLPGLTQANLAATVKFDTEP